MIPLDGSSDHSNPTWSPTATGLVALIPFIRNFPLIPQDTFRPSGSFTVNRLPVDFMTVPFSNAYYWPKCKHFTSLQNIEKGHHIFFVTRHRSPFTIHGRSPCHPSPFTIHHSPFTIHQLKPAKFKTEKATWGREIRTSVAMHVSIDHCIKVVASPCPQPEVLGQIQFHFQGWRQNKNVIPNKWVISSILYNA